MKYIEVKKIIRKSKWVDSFGGLYSFSPYRGCLHDCKYCDGRTEKYHVEGVFHKDIIIRKNTPDLLAKELPKLREYGPICLSSGVSDVYQPLERKEKLTRASLEVLQDFDFPIIIHTKNALLLRDLDLLKKINEKSGVVIMMSVTYLSDEIRRKLEPCASAPQERLETLKICKENGFGVGVLAMPFVPFITDGKEDLMKLGNAFRDIPIDFAFLGGMTLKQGQQKQYYMEFVQQEYPLLLNKTERIYNLFDKYGEPNTQYSQNLSMKMHYAFSGISLRTPHYVYKKIFSDYDSLRILLADLQHLYIKKNKNIERLKLATKKYYNWLESTRSQIARSRTRTYDEIDVMIRTMMLTDYFHEILKNKKLAEFLKKIVLHDYVLNYFTLELHKNRK